MNLDQASNANRKQSCISLHKLQEALDEKRHAFQQRSPSKMRFVRFAIELSVMGDVAFKFEKSHVCDSMDVSARTFDKLQAPISFLKARESTCFWSSKLAIHRQDSRRVLGRSWHLGWNLRSSWRCCCPDYPRNLIPTRERAFDPRNHSIVAWFRAASSFFSGRRSSAGVHIQLTSLSVTLLFPRKNTRERKLSLCAIMSRLLRRRHSGRLRQLSTKMSPANPLTV